MKVFPHSLSFTFLKEQQQQKTLTKVVIIPQIPNKLAKRKKVLFTVVFFLFLEYFSHYQNYNRYIYFFQKVRDLLETPKRKRILFIHLI